MHSTSHDDPVVDPTTEIVTIRVYGAPRERVFSAFADAGRLARWWGPAGFSNIFHEFDFRPGGAWRFAMLGPDGGVFENESEFVEILAPERIVLDHLRPMHWFRMTMTFTDEGGGTRLAWRMRFASAEELDRVREFVAPANEQNLDRLAAELAGM